MKKVLLFSAVAALIACTANQTQAGNKSRSLVVFYSQSGNTEKVANIIQKKTGADIERIETVNPYSGDMGAIAGAFMGAVETQALQNSRLHCLVLKSYHHGMVLELRVLTRQRLK